MDQIVTQAEIDNISLEAIASFVQAELIEKPRLRGTVMDLTSIVGPGEDSVKVPRFNSLIAERKLGATKLSRQKLTSDPDQLYLNKTDGVLVEVEDVAKLQSSVELQELYASRIVSALNKKFDKEIYDALATVSASSPDHDVSFASGSSITKLDFTSSKKKLRAANVDVDEQDSLFMCCDEEVEEDILNNTDFSDADKWGSGSELIKSMGVIGRLYGFYVIVSPQFTYPVFYHKSAAAFAVQQETKFMQAPVPANLSVDLSAYRQYGTKALQAGKAAVRVGAP